MTIDPILSKLVNTPGPSGHENRVREIISERLMELEHEPLSDSIGNLYVVIGEGRPLILLAAHMDEVGFMVKYVDEKGFLRITFLGGLKADRLPGSEVVVLGNERDYYGIIGSIPPHLSRDEKKSEITVDDLFIDVGASSREEVFEMGIEPGTTATFVGNFKDWGKFVSGKAFDDRIGCYVLLKALEDIEPPETGSIVVAFTVQEEVGLRGASVLAHSLQPNFAISIEGTIANDTPGNDESRVVTRMGEGPAIRVMDKTILASERLIKHVRKIAEENDIPYQIQLSPYSGTDAGRFILTGAEVTSISVPVRYIHSPVALAKKDDIDFTIQLLRKLLENPFPES